VLKIIFLSRDLAQGLLAFHNNVPPWFSSYF